MIGMDSKKWFFDRQAVMDAVDRAALRNLSRAGSFIRTAARSSLRKRRRISRPGEPPSVHTADRVATLKNIWFIYDPIQRSVVVGPVKLPGSRLRMSDRETVPALLEFGGTAMVGRRRRVSRYAPRPFMGPAMERELPKFANIWANSVR